MYIKVHQSSSKYIIVCQIISKYIKKSKLSNIHNNDIVTFKTYSAKLVVKKNCLDVLLRKWKQRDETYIEDERLWYLEGNHS